MVSGGTTLGGRYKLDERIAGGGMGDVWRGTDEVLGRTVAVKILLPALLEEPGFAERFRGEARTMATINHPGVVDVYDYGSDPAVGAYLVMEYVEGDALSRTLSRVSRLTPARTMALIAQAADALQAAHEKGIVHRDVKPGNLLVRPNGTLVLTDFGIARSAQVGQLTQAGAVLGTASYISPEQASGSVATPLSDIYALGVVAYQCLSGRRPYEGDNPLEIAMKHVRDTPPPLPADIPPAVRQIVERAMAKDPAARFPHASAFGQVARRAAAALSSGTSTAIGPSGSPVSVPPVPSQTSPGPTGTGPVPRPPVSGTRVMPAGAYPTGRTAAVPPPSSPAGPGMASAPGGYHRGAASVPPPPVRPETGYLPSQPPPSSGRSTMVILGVLIGALVLLVLAAIGWQVMRNAGGRPNTSTTTGTPHNPQNSTGPSTSTTGKLVSTFCEDAKGREYGVVAAILKRDGFQVDRQEVPGRRNIVVEITPCQAPLGSVVTVKVGNGQQPPAGSGTSNAGQTGGASSGTGGGPPSGGLNCSLGVGGGLEHCTPPPPPAQQG
jgi:eukaryotic-like serine/threonine-protein kinase